MALLGRFISVVERGYENGFHVGELFGDGELSELFRRRSRKNRRWTWGTVVIVEV